MDKYCEKCKFFRTALSPTDDSEKWILKAACTKDVSFARSLRKTKEIPSYEAYRKNETKPMPKFSYVRKFLHEEKNWEGIEIPSWCKGFEEK